MRPVTVLVKETGLTLLGASFVGTAGAEEAPVGETAFWAGLLTEAVTATPVVRAADSVSVHSVSSGSVGVMVVVIVVVDDAVVVEFRNGPTADGLTGVAVIEIPDEVELAETDAEGEAEG